MKGFAQYIPDLEFRRLLDVLTYSLRYGDSLRYEKVQLRQLGSSDWIRKKGNNSANKEGYKLYTLIIDSRSSDDTVVLKIRRKESRVAKLHMKYQSVSDRQSSQDEVIEDTKNSEDIPQVMKIEHYSKLIDSSSNSPEGSDKSELREQKQRQADFQRYQDVVKVKD